MKGPPVTEQEIFKAAIKLTGGGRAVFVEQACGPDENLRRNVNALLAAHDESEGFLPRKDPQFEEATKAPSSPLPPATLVVGRYKLIETIGEGGMGSVWLAEQKEPVKRRVAIKLVKPGMDSRAVLGRFEAERQALAMMDHPNIAKVLDGGETEQGRPYFAMELVRGIPITDYCDQTQR